MGHNRKHLGVFQEEKAVAGFPFSPARRRTSSCQRRWLFAH